MPTIKPRLMVTVDQPVADVLKRLSIVQERSSAAIVRELLDQALPLLEEVATTMEAMQRVSDAARERLRVETANDLQTAQEALQPHLEGIMGHMRAMASLGDSEGLGGEARRAGGDPARSASEDGKRPQPGAIPPTQPPYSNTGVRTAQNGNKPRRKAVGHG